MNQRFAIHRVIPVGILTAALVLPGSSSFAQQSDSSSLPRAQQLPPSGRAQSGSTVQAEQSSSANGGTSSVNTVNSTIQVSGAYQRSTPDPNAPPGCAPADVRCTAPINGFYRAGSNFREDGHSAGY